MSQDLDEIALGHVVKLRGHLPASAASAWADEQARPAEALVAIERAAKRFADAPRALFRCRGEACREAAGSVDVRADLPVIDTGCQGNCEHAPMATLMFDGASRSFGGLGTPDAWAAVEVFAGRCAKEGTALVEDGAVRSFLFDPMHAEHGPDLSAFAFLQGHFRGTGHYAVGKHSFHKEVIGRWEASGAALCLRMEVAYPLPRGGVDAHEACVWVTPERDGDFWLGYAITDGGATRQYRYAVDPQTGALYFEDRPPGHGHSAKDRAQVADPQ